MATSGGYPCGLAATEYAPALAHLALEGQGVTLKDPADQGSWTCESDTGNHTAMCTFDPWGNRYAVNIKALADGTSCVVVVSAGPNGQIETPFAGAAITAGGDDVVALMATVR